MNSDSKQRKPMDLTIKTDFPVRKDHARIPERFIASPTKNALDFGTGTRSGLLTPAAMACRSAS
jgi:hypothetical protein